MGFALSFQVAPAVWIFLSRVIPKEIGKTNMNKAQLEAQAARNAESVVEPSTASH